MTGVLRAVCGLPLAKNYDTRAVVLSHKWALRENYLQA
jgi:hypothetical protein